MKINDFQIYKYNLPLIEPLHIGKKILNRREGAIIRITIDSDLHVFGEAAPLPGLHKENFQNTIHQLKIMRQLLNGKQIKNIFETIAQLQHENRHYPSAQFAIESALLNLNKTTDNQLLNNLFPRSFQDKIFINSLATGSLISIKDRVEQSLRDNYRSIKIKVGRQIFDEEINLIKDIQKRLHESITLRLDANRRWSFEEAITFIGRIGSGSIEYIEEPLKDSTKLPELYIKTGVPIALDESLTDISPEKSGYEDWVNTIILKPAVIGSVQKTLHYMTWAKNHGIKVVISDTFHSGIGLAFLIRLASIIDKQIPMGFDTYNWLEDDVLLERIPIKNGCFDLKTVMNLSKQVDYAKLERLV
jgi:O-succinylbenzoate synthase